MDPEPLKHAPRGYVSEEAKRKFTLTVGILGAAFFFGQMIIPFILMMLFMPAFLLTGGFDLSQVDVGSAAAWKDQTWYVSRRISGPGRPSNSLVIWSLAPGADARPVERGTVNLESAWLLAGRDRLWVIGAQEVRFFQDSGLSEPLRTEPISAISRPFLHKDAPALVQRTPEGHLLMTLTKEGWRKEGLLPLGAEEPHPQAWDVRFVSSGNEVHVFRKVDDTIYHHAGIPPGGGGSWNPVASSGRNWAAGLIGDVPAVFFQSRGEGFSATVLGVRLRRETWEQFFSHNMPMTAQLGVVSAGPDRVALLVEGFPGSLRIFTVQDGKVTGERKVGKSFPIPGFFVGFFVMIQVGSLATPLLLALILSGLMARHRACEFGAGDQKMPLASLARRAFAQIIDMVIDTAPLMACSLTMFLNFDDFMMSPPFGMLKNFGLVMLGFAWLVITFFLFSWTEGRSGWTPGKGLLGIRVLGTDLQPCGFGRALVRNLLKFADGFMNFMVGILVSALSENWQRVGDMAARTVVVRVHPRHN